MGKISRKVIQTILVQANISKVCFIVIVATNTYVFVAKAIKIMKITVILQLERKERKVTEQEINDMWIDHGGES